MTKEETAVDEVAERPENNTEAERKPRKKVKLAVEPAGSPDAPSAEKPVEKASEPKPTAKGRGDSAPGNSDGESDDAGNQDDDGDDDGNKKKKKKVGVLDLFGDDDEEKSMSERKAFLPPPQTSTENGEEEVKKEKEEEKK